MRVTSMAVLMLLAACSRDQTSKGASFKEVPVHPMDSLFPTVARLPLRPPADVKIGIATGLLVTPTQALVADPTQGSVKVFDRRTGELVRQIGRPGDGPGEFRIPAALEFDDQGRITIIDAGRHIVARTDTAGRPLVEQLPGSWEGLASLSGGGRLLLVGRASTGSGPGNNPGDRQMVLHELDSAGRVQTSYGETAWPTNPLEASFTNPFATASGNLVVLGFYRDNEVRFRDRATGRQWSARIGAPWYRTMDLSKPLPKATSGHSGLDAFGEFVKRQVMLVQLFTLPAERFLGEFRMFAPDGEMQWGYVVFDSAGRSLAATPPGSSQILRVTGDSVYAIVPDQAGDLVMETRALSALVRR